jgi:hypothetical protein
MYSLVYGISKKPHLRNDSEHSEHSTKGFSAMWELM